MNKIIIKKEGIMVKKADAVFEGGGVKGIGLVGAVYELENAGYEGDSYRPTMNSHRIRAAAGLCP